MHREEAHLTREEKAKISEKALVKVNVDHDTEWAKTEATRKEYLDKMRAHTDRARHTLDFDKMLGEKKVQFDKKEWDLTLWEATLVEAQARGFNPRDNREELTELVKL
jgi:hypothetical protein